MEDEAKGLGTPMQVLDDPGTITGLVGGRAGVDVVHPVTQSVIKENRDLARSRGDRLDFADARGEPPVKGTQGGVGSSNRHRGEPQERRGPAPRAARTRRKRRATMIFHPNANGHLRPGCLSRRGLLLGAGAASIAASLKEVQAADQVVDYTIRIGPVSLELAPDKTIKTTGYNGSVPGPVLRLREGRPLNIRVINDAGYPDLVHWHGLYLPALQDGATEEGSPIIPVGEYLLYSFTPRPTGTRWYHSHAMAMTDLTRSTYSGEFGFLTVEPAAGEPGNYDREVLLAARRWEGMWVSMQDLRKGPPPDNGLEVMYHAATLGQRMLGHDEPIRVR